ncbi:MAG: endonuclease/exonuclease/phosphatase family protein [Planctomycetota bacterium]
MRRLLTTLLLGLFLVGGGWALVNRDKLQSSEDWLKLVGQQVERLRDSWSVPARLASWTQPQLHASVVRIATFNIQAFGPAKAANAEVVQYLAEICRHFDVIAIQEIRGQDQALLPQFVKKINSQGASYGFVLSPPLGRNTYREQAAFIFNQDVVHLDNAYSYTINDPDDVMIREPYVGWFRTTQAPADQAFTFSLVNLHLDSRRSTTEMGYLQELFRIVRSDGRGEDDVLLIGDFNLGERSVERAGKKTGLAPVLRGATTNTRGTKHYDNILLDVRATSEFTGQSGVFDFLRQFNLTIEQALAISDHLPVWAEFSVLEGGAVRQAAATTEERTAGQR